jgi:hypothetical protein
MNPDPTMTIPSDPLQPVLAADNARMREALRVIADLAEQGEDVVAIGKIARTALIHAVPEDRDLRHSSAN